MLIGQYEGTLGSKRRLVIPAKFRQELGEKPIIARWYETCLVLVPLERWQELLKRVRGEAKLVTEPVRDIERFIMGSAYELETDELGRVIIPGNLVVYAGILTRVVFLGLGDRVEVWSKETWDEKEKKIADQARQALEKLADEEKKPRVSNDS